MPTKAGIKFMEASRDDAPEKSPQDAGIPQSPLELPIGKNYPLISLESPDNFILPQIDFWEILSKRKTLRKYQDTPLTLDELTTMLWFTQGVKSINTRPATERIVPSAGARHPFETYLVVTNITGLEPGLYRYIALQHKLAFLDQSADLADRVWMASHNQNHVRNCPVSFWWEANVMRTIWRYRTRGYRYIMMDVGHICQNLYLVAEALGCGICPIGSFSDAELNQIFGSDGEDRMVIYGATVGKR